MYVQYYPINPGEVVSSLARLISFRPFFARFFLCIHISIRIRIHSKRWEKRKEKKMPSSNSSSKPTKSLITITPQ